MERHLLREQRSAARPTTSPVDIHGQSHVSNCSCRRRRHHLVCWLPDVQSDIQCWWGLFSKGRLGDVWQEPPRVGALPRGDPPIDLSLTQLTFLFVLDFCKSFLLRRLQSFADLLCVLLLLVHSYIGVLALFLGNDAFTFIHFVGNKSVELYAHRSVHSYSSLCLAF